MIVNKIADKITIVSKKSAKDLHNNETEEEDVKRTTSKERYISPEERQQNIDELKLTLKRYISPKERQQIIDELRLV